MLNQIVVVGRITKDVEIKETNYGKAYANITIAVPRSYKNNDGEYDTDFIPVTLWNNMATNTMEYVRKGDIIGIRGTMQSSGKDLYVNAEKVTFLSSRKD